MYFRLAMPQRAQLSTYLADRLTLVYVNETELAWACHAHPHTFALSQ